MPPCVITIAAGLNGTACSTERLRHRRYTAGMATIEWVGFDADDTLWRSEDYYRHAQAAFERILARYIDVADVHGQLLQIEQGNLALFGYGAKGMTLSMLETAIAMTDARIQARDLHAIVQLGKEVLRHPVELLPDVRQAVEAIAARHRVVLITKGDLFHQEAKLRQSGMRTVFPRVEIVSEKDAATYARVLAECGVAPERFVMIGNSLRSDALPVLALGGWAIHTPYHVTWQHELAEAPVGPQAQRLRTVSGAAGWDAALRAVQATMRAQAA